MDASLDRRLVMGWLIGAIAGCAPTAEQQAAGFAPNAATTAIRARQSRRFETADRMLMLRSAVGVLQDLGFAIEETQTVHGVIVGSKTIGSRVRVQIVLSPSADRTATMVRTTFQRYIARPGAMLGVGETLDDPVLYQGFFEKLAQSTLLTAHEI